jgi:hypothetical protein
MEVLIVSRELRQYIDVSLVKESDASGRDVGDETGLSRVGVGDSDDDRLVAFDERRLEIPCANIEESLNPSKIRVILIIVVIGYSSRSPFLFSIEWAGAYALHASHLICEEIALIC